MKRPIGIFSVCDFWAGRGCETEVTPGRWVRAVCFEMVPLWYNRLRAAWWVFLGRAHAVVWPKPGDFERIRDAE